MGFRLFRCFTSAIRPVYTRFPDLLSHPCVLSVARLLSPSLRLLLSFQAKPLSGAFLSLPLPLVAGSTISFHQLPYRIPLSRFLSPSPFLSLSLSLSLASNERRLDSWGLWGRKNGPTVGRTDATSASLSFSFSLPRSSSPYIFLFLSPPRGSIYHSLFLSLPRTPPVLSVYLLIATSPRLPWPRSAAVSPPFFTNPSFPSSQARSAASTSIARSATRREREREYLLSRYVLFLSLRSRYSLSFSRPHDRLRLSLFLFRSGSPVFLRSFLVLPSSHGFLASSPSSLSLPLSLGPKLSDRASSLLLLVLLSLSLSLAFTSYARYKLVGRRGVFV